MDQMIASVDNIILGFVQGSFGSLTASVQTLWQLMFVVFMAFYGYKVLVSHRFSASDLVTHCIKIILVLVLATQWAAFFQLIYTLATNLPSDISGQVVSAASNTLGAQAQINSVANANTLLMQFYSRAMSVDDKLLQMGSWTQPGPYIYFVVVWLGAVFFTGYATMLIILAKLAVAVILAVGPLFILLYIFHDTRKLLEGWLRTLINYAIVPVFVYALLALLLTLVMPTLVFLENNSGPYQSYFTAVSSFIAATFIATLLLQQIMSIAANITGGVSLSTMGGFAFATTPITGPGKIAARKAGDAALEGGKKVAKTGMAKIKSGYDALKRYLGNRSEAPK